MKEHLEYSILTAEISRATFGMTPSEYKEFKALEKQRDNLRDHMNDLELIFTMLGEASTTEIARNKDAQVRDSVITRLRLLRVERWRVTPVESWKRSLAAGLSVETTSRRFLKL